MRRNKLKKFIVIAVFLCVSSVPVMAYAKDTRINGEVTQQSKVVFEENWLTDEVAKQLNKKVKDLTELDFLNITKIKLSQEKIRDEIPKEIKLLKNLESLELNYSYIKGKIPEELGDLPKLTYLDLGENEIESLPDNVMEKIKSGKYTYCDIEGNTRINLDEGWYHLKGKMCYIDNHGERLKGEQEINGKTYHFTDDGYLREGWETDKDNNKLYYDKDKGLVTNDWKSISGKWYYFNDKGIMQKGMQTIKGAKYYFDNNGVMLIGWQKVDNNWYFFNDSGAMQYGWLSLGGKTYYLDKSTGVMATGDATVDGKKYRFSNDGSIIGNIWVDSNTYVKPNGESVNVSSNFSHSNTNLQLFKYMTDVNNQASVDSTAVALHGGDTKNNCVYFSSEALRRIGVNIPTGTCNTYQFENILKNMGFTYSYDFSQIKPGDIVFTNGYTHVYIFMGWDKDGYAYIVDNQGSMYGGTLHRRLVLQDSATTDRATHFFYYPY